VKIRTCWAATAAASLVLVAGCGGSDDKSSDSTAVTTPPSSAKPAKPAGKLPAYEDVKKIALADPQLKSLCGKDTEDRDIGVSAEGEQYKRLFCQGLPVLDYVVGKQGFKENYQASVKAASQPVWKSGQDAYVKVQSASASDGFAEKVKKECGCGEVVQAG
jgi:hypothetical protein